MLVDSLVRLWIHLWMLVDSLADIMDSLVEIVDRVVRL
jgi:hypothetical protein